MKEKNAASRDRFLTIIIVAVALSGIGFFGTRALLENRRKQGDNPYVYRTDRYEPDQPQSAGFIESAAISLDISGASGIAAGEWGYWICGIRELVRLDPDGRVLNRITVDASATAIAVGSERLYTAFTDHIRIYSTEGAELQRTEPIEKAWITSLALSASKIYAADAGNRIVHQFSFQGQKLSEIGYRDDDKDIPGLVIPSPYFDVAIDTDGLLWAANTGRHSMENYREDGSLRAFWGRYGAAPDDFCGCCNPSHFVITASGDFITLEKGIPRIKHYDRAGQLTELIAGPGKFSGYIAGQDLALSPDGKVLLLDGKSNKIRIFQRGTLQD